MADRALQGMIDSQERAGRRLRLEAALGGGSICEAWLMRDQHGARYFAKTASGAPQQLFFAEAAGLAALRDSACLRVPQTLEVESQWLLLEYIDTGRPSPASWEQLGQSLAGMHRQAVAGFGFTMDNFCGRTPQPNPREADGHRFFAEQRLLYQGRLARRRGLLPGADLTRLERLCAQLQQHLPTQAPALLHGDLWSGNLLFSQAGEPVLIDPAAYWGWPEADIAMTRLFGGFAPAFYAAWAEAFEPLPGWEERLDLYNLYHLLNHLNLFGRSYFGQVQAVLRRYA